MDNKQFNDTVKYLDKAMKTANQSKETALKSLQQAGIVTKNGKLSKTYRKA